ncbi:MAG TPA: amidohydrolase family protein [Stellaceae bacterium]|nr:amidohydrolase family protein [Stellaceae bacterium]
MTTMDRRTFLAAATVTATASPANARAKGKGAIDVHHHAAPDFFMEDLRLRGPVNPGYQGWTPERSLADMEAGGIATAMISFNNVWAGDDARAARLARRCNDYAARMAQDHKGRFGRFVALPLPNVEASLKEIEYGLDQLKADGVHMMTSYGDKWLGEPAFLPVMEELNRRKAVIYTHPTTAKCCGNLIPGIMDVTVEYNTDTTRAIAGLMFRGTLKRCPDLRFIFSHAGGTAPYIMWRFEAQARNPATRDTVPAAGVVPTMREHYYDCAQSAHPVTMQALAKLVPTAQILFGSDYPFTTAKAHMDGLATCGFSATALRAIKRDNAVRLLPTVKT